MQMRQSLSQMLYALISHESKNVMNDYTSIEYDEELGELYIDCVFKFNDKYINTSFGYSYREQRITESCCECNKENVFCIHMAAAANIMDESSDAEYELSNYSHEYEHMIKLCHSC